MFDDDEVILGEIEATETERDRLVRELTEAGRAFREGRGSYAEVWRLAGLVAAG
jgi:hypothetical protein